jgi:hypothetical protein
VSSVNWRKRHRTGISCTSNPCRLHEFPLPGRLDLYAVWTWWMLPIHYELSRLFDLIHNSSSPEEQNCWGSGLSVNWHLLYVRCPVYTAERNGRKFAKKIIQNLVDMWSGMKFVHGKPRHSQSQGSVERSNQDVRDILVAWLSDNNTKTWSEGLRFIQIKKNQILHSSIETSPYEVMFGIAQRIGFADSPLT